MFNFLQHLFTARALQTELANAKAENTELKAQLLIAHAQIQKLEQDVQIRDKHIEAIKKSRPRFADGAEPYGWMG